MKVPCENSTPKTSAPVSVWVSKWTMPTGPWTPAQARTDGSVIEWSPPSTAGSTPAARTWPTVASIAACERSGAAGTIGASPKSTTRSSSSASTLTSRCGPGGELAAADRARGEPCARAVGDELVHRRADDRDVEALELRRILRDRHAREAEHARVVGLLAVLRPPRPRIQHQSSLSTLIVSNAGSLAPCRRAPLPASSRR